MCKGVKAMQEVVRESRREYWRPERGSLHIANAVLPEGLCQRCGAEFAIGARFCHVCGIEREARTATPARTSLADFLDLDLIRKRLGISVGSLIFFLAGLVCLIAAALTGAVYRADTLEEWQALQVWRIEWLLAGIASLLLGVLLKRKDA